MKEVIVINRLSIKPGKMDEFIEAQRTFAAGMRMTPNALVGGRMYRSVDGTSAVLVSIFASTRAQDEVRQLPAFKEHLARLQPMIESSSPGLYEEAYTTGTFQ